MTFMNVRLCLNDSQTRVAHKEQNRLVGVSHRGTPIILSE